MALLWTVAPGAGFRGVSLFRSSLATPLMRSLDEAIVAKLLCTVKQGRLDAEVYALGRLNDGTLTHVKRLRNKHQTYVKGALRLNFGAFHIEHHAATEPRQLTAAN